MSGDDHQQLSALVLSIRMTPQGVLRWDKAVTLAVTGKVDVLEEYDVECRSPSISLRFPAVVRVRRAFRKHKDGVKFSRANVYARDNYRCCYCNHKFRAKQLNYDHVLPRVRGGKTVWENIVTTCYPCNTRKGSRTPREAGMTMHYQPHKPEKLPESAPLLIDMSRVPALWLPYLTSIAQTA